MNNETTIFSDLRPFYVLENGVFLEAINYLSDSITSEGDTNIDSMDVEQSLEHTDVVMLTTIAAASISSIAAMWMGYRWYHRSEPVNVESVTVKEVEEIDETDTTDVSQNPVICGECADPTLSFGVEEVIANDTQHDSDVANLNQDDKLNQDGSAVVAPIKECGNEADDMTGNPAAEQTEVQDQPVSFLQKIATFFSGLFNSITNFVYSMCAYVMTAIGGLVGGAGTAVTATNPTNEGLVGSSEFSHANDGLNAHVAGVDSGATDVKPESEINGSNFVPIS